MYIKTNDGIFSVLFVGIHVRKRHQWHNPRTVQNISVKLFKCIFPQIAQELCVVFILYLNLYSTNNYRMCTGVYNLLQCIFPETTQFIIVLLFLQQRYD